MAIFETRIRQLAEVLKTVEVGDEIHVLFGGRKRKPPSVTRLIVTDDKSLQLLKAES